MVHYHNCSFLANVLLLRNLALKVRIMFIKITFLSICYYHVYFFLLIVVDLFCIQ